MSDARPTVLVLGASGGIGSAVQERFEREGHEVVGTSSADLNLTDPEGIERWCLRSRPSFGVLVHSAGRNFPAPFDELTEAEIRTCFDTNVTGFLDVMRHLRPELVENRGRVVVLSSLFGFLSRRGRLAYAMSKHALVGVVKTLALELGPQGVLVNAVSPGYIETRLTHQNNDEASIAHLETAIPLRRLGTPEDVAEAVYFLGSEHNRYINGHDLVVDGGLSVDGGRD